MATGRVKGKVKWFNNAKGYGFILPEDGSEELFAHYSSIAMDGYKTLKAGQDVDFEVMEVRKDCMRAIFTRQISLSKMVRQTRTAIPPKCCL